MVTLLVNKGGSDILIRTDDLHVARLLWGGELDAGQEPTLREFRRPLVATLEILRKHETEYQFVFCEGKRVEVGFYVSCLPRNDGRLMSRVGRCENGRDDARDGELIH